MRLGSQPIRPGSVETPGIFFLNQCREEVKYWGILLIHALTSTEHYENPFDETHLSVQDTVVQLAVQYEEVCHKKKRYTTTHTCTNVSRNKGTGILDDLLKCMQ